MLSELNDDSPGNYWLLFLIGERVYRKSKYYVEFWFVNCNEENDRSYNTQHVKKILLPDSFLSAPSLYTFGSIFDKSGNFIKSHNEYATRSASTIIKKDFQIVSDNFKTFDKKNSIFPYFRKENVESLRFYKLYDYQNQTIIILPIILLYKYFFLLDNKLTYYLSQCFLDGILENLFFKIEAKKGIGHFYHKECITKTYAKHLGRYFFTKGNKGIFTLGSMFWNLSPSISKYRAKQVIPFNTDISISVKGKEHIYKNKKYLFAYSISELDLIDTDVYTVNEIFHTPIVRRESTSKRDEKEIDSRINTKTSIDITTDSKIDSESESNMSVDYKGIDTVIFKDALKAKRVNRTDQLEKLIGTFGKENIIDGLTLNPEESSSSDKGFINFVENKAKFHFEEFIINILNNMSLEGTISYNIVSPAQGVNTFSIGNIEVIVIKINYQERYYYVCEVEPLYHQHFIGFFSNSHFNEIPINTLEKYLIEAEKKLFKWSHIPNEVCKKNEIIIYQSLQHSSGNEKEDINKKMSRILLQKLSRPIPLQMEKNSLSNQKGECLNSEVK